MGGSQSLPNNNAARGPNGASRNIVANPRSPQREPQSNANPQSDAPRAQPSNASRPPHSQHSQSSRERSSQTAKVVVMNNDLSLLQNSIKLVKNAQNPKMYSVTFTLDALFETIVSAFFFVHDMRDPLLEITYELTPDEKYKVPPKHLKYPAGRFIKIAENCYSIELEKYNVEEISHHTTSFYPLILRIEKIDSQKREKKIFFYYFHFSKEETEYGIKLIRQKMELNGQAYEVNEIYGINSSEFGKQQSATIGDSEKECIICFADQRDTIILPCRHMCLCLTCAKSFQSQNSSKCPICRKDIESFLRLTKNMQTTDSLQPQLDDAPNVAQGGQ